ncbi:hypothetical protein [Aliikangiella sp. IMCC44359]|uniref:hypothetical protein n=1 Tax=Aliikangiella sp. IMCC44359 TaxID=3459125 RepID=UPI00403B2AF2
MTTYPNSPNIAKAGIVMVDAKSGKTISMITLQYNSESLSRSYEPQNFGEGGQGNALRYKGPAVETLTIEADIDAADQLEFPDEFADVVEHGIQPQIAALEALINPTSEQLNNNNILASAGTLEIAPMEAPMALFVWSKNRIVAVSFSSFSITEEAFDTNLNPIRAKVNLTMKVLNVNDVGFKHKAGSLFMNYLQNKERLATKATGASLNDFGIDSLPF